MTTGSKGSIWKKGLSLYEINEMSTGTIHEPLGISYTEIGEQGLSGAMPVDGRTKQPFGYLHGGASVVLAESLGSMAAYLACDEGETPLGIEVNANHLQAVREGSVRGTAKPVHLGRSLQVWGIELFDDRGRLTCVARLTVSIRVRPAATT
jgi:1,4-dihydroxy-2-naphthoyl-CoA hydrolase